MEPKSLSMLDRINPRQISHKQTQAATLISGLFVIVASSIVQLVLLFFVLDCLYKPRIDWVDLVEFALPGDFSSISET